MCQVIHRRDKIAYGSLHHYIFGIFADEISGARYEFWRPTILITQCKRIDEND